jgi:PPOX class probable F420-dependent enzyme
VPSLDRVRAFVPRDHGLVVVVTQRRDGSPQTSVVNAGVLEHPVTGDSVVGFVIAGDTLKHRHLRERSRATIVFRAGWEWVAVEGPAELIGPDDAPDTTDVPRLLRDVFTAAGGTHEDWDEYDRVMAAERRLAVLVSPERVYPSTNS